ncbi:septal ring lytic transglycosylase RlpA family protein [Flavobacterium sp. GA093]|uniref:Probable endolytic peptidoglycan transglycosylase RlpA n=1 Tax=Flavobacterium hydrocarbonoxydans TaxID=2683249 RepID=A0A6I4NJE4_9FLAO|nr:septal ring lytic transglycosylase RlpA family protein [Flavobacterium hydrocarbonoxydans]MWB94616.1 septal ring lytic transglycosylase RlpA family protein [Flavobacterium hydrocarbonoxydans]
MKKIILYTILIISAFGFAQKKSTKEESKEEIEKYTLYKTNAHASYYNDKFNGKRTASGKRFNNNKLTAAHKTFAFGTKLKITNEQNDKSVIVEVIDRGPFSKKREIDLTKKAFMKIASNKRSGSMNVKIEILRN